MTTLCSNEISRYKRQLILPKIGYSGQEKLKKSRVLVIGAGGLGSPLLLYLAGAGVGHIGLIDFDRVDESNLQRQVLYTTDDVGELKAEVAQKKIQALNPYVSVSIYKKRFSAENALEIISQYDVVADATDNFASRYLVNDACVIAKKANVFGSASEFEGQVSIFCANDGPCYRCLFREPPPFGFVGSCAENGVLGVVPGLIGSIQATEILKLLTGVGQNLVGRFLQVNSFDMRFRELIIHRDPTCPICGENASITKLEKLDILCSSNSAEVEEITAEKLFSMLEKNEQLDLIDVREAHNLSENYFPNAKIFSLKDLILGKFVPNTSNFTVIICEEGERSAQAVLSLKEQGYEGKLVTLQGGVKKWKETTC